MVSSDIDPDRLLSQAVAAGDAYWYLEESPTFTLPNRLSVSQVPVKHGVGEPAVQLAQIRTQR